MHLHNSFRIWFFPLVLGSIAFEISWYLLVQKRSYPWREMLISVGVYILRMPARGLAPLILGPLAYFVWSHRLITIPLNTAWGPAGRRPTAWRPGWALAAGGHWARVLHLRWIGMATGGGFAILAGLLIGAMYASEPAPDVLLTMLQPTPIDIVAN